MENLPQTPQDVAILMGEATDRLIQNSDFQVVILDSFIDNYIHTAYLNLPVFTGEKEKQVVDRIKARGILQRYLNEIMENAKLAIEQKEEDANRDRDEREALKIREKAESN